MGTAGGRRLRRLGVHLQVSSSAAELDASVAVADEVATAPRDDEQWVRPQHELHEVAPLPPPDPELMRLLSLGELDVSKLSPEAVRSMMRPEPNQPSETEANMSGFMPYHGTTKHNMGQPKLPLPALWDDAARGVSQSALARCQEMQREAAEAEDYEAASTLKQLVKVLSPQPPRTALDCSPDGAAAKAQFFYENGFVVLRDVISPDHLSKLQAAWMHIESEELPKFMEARSHGIGISRHSFHHMEDGHDNVGRKITGFPFERLMALEPSAALDPLDNPETLEVLSRILVGPEDYDYHFYMGELRISGAGPSIYPPDADGAGYTYWHRDHPQPHRWPISRSRDVKMFVNVFDVPENGGPLSVVPGSHRLPFNPWEIFGKSFKSSLTLDADLDQTDMPNHVKFAAPAGCALIFDTSCWHTPMPNTSGQPRRVYNASYRASTGNGGDTTWDIANLVPEERMTPTLARLIGQDTSHRIGTPAGTPSSYQR